MQSHVELATLGENQLNQIITTSCFIYNPPHYSSVPIIKRNEAQEEYERIIYSEKKKYLFIKTAENLEGLWTCFQIK
ncbi:unnamed protein product [Adineta ricciae]|uniref:Uncharacterized protein n=1 Tax=Adineta ricciae TaxID=249248 RepID=A0A815D7J7_ADIRI|nr:unnamed protein product [Adineta ricciae]